MVDASIGASVAGPVFARYGYGMVGIFSFVFTFSALATLLIGAQRR